MSHMNELCRLWMSHVTCEWVMSHMQESSHVWIGFCCDQGVGTTRPKSFVETGFWLLCPSFVYFVPLSRSKPAFWISTRKPIFGEPGSIMVDGFDTRLIPRSFSCGLMCSLLHVLWMDDVIHEWVMAHMSESWHIWTCHGTHKFVMSHKKSNVTHEYVVPHINESWHTWMSRITYERVTTHEPARL